MLAVHASVSWGDFLDADLERVAALHDAVAQKLRLYDSLQASVAWTVYASSAGKKRRLKPADFLLLRD